MGLIEDLKASASNEKAAFFPRFFKTGKGEYGEGDVFIGVTVPQIRTVAKKHHSLSLDELHSLLHHEIHEVRLASLLILVAKYQKADEQGKKRIVDFYLTHTNRINNWDLVDSSADKILGAYLFERDKEILYEFARSKVLWERRIAIIATYWFIKKGKFEDTFAIAGILLKDREDLIHKAVGWMLREVGKRDVNALEKFLDLHSKEMPRTMLRYAIEKFDEKKRALYLRKT